METNDKKLTICSVFIYIEISRLLCQFHYKYLHIDKNVNV
ncbi:hypothetical protein CPS_1967 [Colwellia psychrerythraea 34H]|uniref:Uncharacterized protein n=1 Tax=Colwellia psychrerythraea (strain 34H / ATCC BAA-681) TaxID=167879 RepID=Q483R9_COLP3|nr:hypothetical protein CPS_1967 [Colwellia psychrerythraea 34H]